MALVKSTSPHMLQFFSLKSQKVVHVFRFPSSIRKIKCTEANSEHPKLFVMLQEGYLKVIDLKEFEQDFSMKTFRIGLDERELNPLMT